MYGEGLNEMHNFWVGACNCTIYHCNEVEGMNYSDVWGGA